MSLVDWREAGLRADAHRVRNLYRQTFAGEAKRLARRRAIEALVAAGATTVVTLWGGGLCCDEMIAAGLRVIAVDNGSLQITDRGRPVSADRKRRALEYAASEGGYEWRWGNADRFLVEGDAAYLDFHGPWTAKTRRAVHAARHMRAVAVTLMPDHDFMTNATTQLERQMAYQVFLKMAWAERPRWESLTATGHVRRLVDYHGEHRQLATVFLLAQRHVRIGTTLTRETRAKMRRDIRDRVRANARAYYYRHRDRILEQQRAATRDRPSPERACTICGDMFATRRATKRYCGEACYREGRNRSQLTPERQATKRAWYARKKATAVCGTAAEAIEKAA